MRFEALASSSHGNAYVVSDGQTRILLECGLAYRTLQKALGFAVCELDGVLVSHEHKDHARCAAQISASGQTVYMSCGTALDLGLAEEKEIEVDNLAAGASDPMAGASNPPYGTTRLSMERVRAVIGNAGVELIEHGRQFRIGTLDVVPFRTYHDAAEPLGFVIRSRLDGDVLAFATDTVNLRYRFPGLTMLAIEANYDDEILARSTRLPDKTKDRIRNTHMEIDTLCSILRGMDLKSCRDIWLLHLSDAMSREYEFRYKVQWAVPAGIRVHVCQREAKDGK